MDMLADTGRAGERERELPQGGHKECVCVCVCLHHAMSLTLHWSDFSALQSPTPKVQMKNDLGDTAQAPYNISYTTQIAPTRV